MAAAALGGTLWTLDAPGATWPWATAGAACFLATLLVFVADEAPAAARVQALLALALAAPAFGFAAERFFALDYAGIGWACRATAAAHVLNAVVRLLVRAPRRP